MVPVARLDKEAYAQVFQEVGRVGLGDIPLEARTARYAEVPAVSEASLQ